MAHPSNLTECFIDLQTHMTHTDLAEFRTQPDEQSAADTFHMTIGLWMRDQWDLWIPDAPLVNLFREYGITHADDITEVILICFYRYINNLPLYSEDKLKTFAKGGHHGIRLDLDH